MYKLTDLPTRPAIRLSAALGVFFLLLTGSVHVSAQAGNLDLSFNSTGYATTSVGTSDSQSNAIAVQADGKTVVAGWARGAATGQDFAVVRYNSDGSLDSTFDGDGKALIDISSTTNDIAYSVAIQATGRS